MLVEARPEAAIRIVPRMNYMLKEVKSEDENYSAFTDPSFRVPSLLADLLASFAKAQARPARFILLALIIESRDRKTNIYELPCADHDRLANEDRSLLFNRNLWRNGNTIRA